MNDQNDEGQTWALLVLAGVIAMVVGGVIGLAAYTSAHRADGSTTAAAPAEDETAGSVYFEVGSATIPATASETIVKVADAARDQTGTTLVISGFHDSSGDAVANAELAKQRALAVRHALEANGVAPERLLLVKPEDSSAAADARQARRVDMRLR